MLGSLARHSFVAILLAVIVEELGIPLPIPTDVMIVFAGTTTGGSLPRLGLFFVTLSVASAIGGSGLYLIVRRGGRRLVERYGSYVHLGPEQLARSEALLARSGWGGIAVGRAIPGLRYATVIACGLLKVPYPRYVTAHLAGSSVYIVTFLILGAIFGPAILDRIHLPALGVRLVWLLLLAVGLPLLVVWWSSRVRSRQPADPSRRRVIGAVLLSSFAGATALSATLSATATFTELLRAPHPLNVTYMLLGRLLDLGSYAGLISLLSYAVLLSLLVGAGAAYYELVLPYLRLLDVSPYRQGLGLALLALGLLGLVFVSASIVGTDGSPRPSWEGGPILLLGLVLGVAIYAITVVYGRALAITIAPTSWRGASEDPGG